MSKAGISGGVILLAEDNPDDVLLIQRAFRAAGIATPVLAVGDGEEAKRYIQAAGPYADRNQFPLPRLILLDLDMPRMNGLQFLTWLRQQSGMKLLPVIVLTASVFASDIRAAYLLGANSFLTKPVDFTALTSAIKQMCDFWLGTCHLPEVGPTPEIPKAA